ncbi:amino acid adenylation domain-containing protein [Streptomyces sp. NPDC020807]|uniref:amino acid adenylation domain-containing protein n=1 Tax=Streptomyces sp. NPDC020807 TaxID=3155119 RepID=UPI0033F91BE6
MATTPYAADAPPTVSAEETLHAAVARRAAERPTHPALLDRGVPIDYRTLDRAADHLARLLTEQGIGPGSLVPVLLARSARLVLVQLALLKAGAAYSVLDPTWPAGRLASLVGRLRSPLAVADPGEHAFPVWTPPDQPLTALAASAAPAGTPSPGQVDSASPAMVIFTSGTTGTPKAVVLPHRAALRLFRDHSPAAFGPDHVLPQVSNPVWDMYAMEVWGTLVAGGTCLLPEEPYFLPDSLRAAVADRGANTVHLPTALFHLFVDTDPRCFAGLRKVLVSGEAMSAAHAARFLRAHPDTALVNCYGPVECCMFVSSHRLAPRDCESPGGVPLGTASPGTRLYVMEDGVLCPPGTPGEICVAGEGLADGYIGQPELTAERFTAVPVDGRPTRVYRTGDQGWVDEEGRLRYVGRRDRQVKLRGFRVEPAEVERAGRAVAGVLDCAAVPIREADGGYQSMVLAYTAAPGVPAPAAPTGPTAPAASAASAAPAVPPTDPLGVRRALAAALPEFLVPSRAVVVPRLPLTPNGKLDRAALEEWGSTHYRRRTHG